MNSFYIFKDFFKTLKKTKEHVTRTVCDVQDLKHLLPSPLWKKFGYPCSIATEALELQRPKGHIAQKCS